MKKELIEIWTDGRTYQNLYSGFTIRLLYKQYDWIRCVQLGQLTTNLTELKAIEYALLSITDEYLDNPINIYTSSRYSIMMLENVGGVWKNNTSNKFNAVVVNRIRALYVRFKHLSIFFSEDDVIENIKAMNEKCNYTKRNFFNKAGK